jgi:hypothetical protein
VNDFIWRGQSSICLSEDGCKLTIDQHRQTIFKLSRRSDTIFVSCFCFMAILEPIAFHIGRKGAGRPGSSFRVHIRARIPQIAEIHTSFYTTQVVNCPATCTAENNNCKKVRRIDVPPISTTAQNVQNLSTSRRSYSSVLKSFGFCAFM